MKLTMDNEKLNFTLKSKTESLKNLNETLLTLTNENTRIQNRFESLSEENKNLHDVLQQRVEQVEQLKHELDGVKKVK